MIDPLKTEVCHPGTGSDNRWKRWLATAYFLLACFVFLVAAPYNRSLQAAEHTEPSDAVLAPSNNVPNRYGVSVIAGNTYDPRNDTTFVQISGCALLDHAKVFRRSSPPNLRFKVEGSLGATTRPDTRLIASGNIFALYYIGALTAGGLKPYVEGGIGLIYTDFRVDGQGLRFNFNPQLGIGAEFGDPLQKPFFMAARLHHISNGGLHHDNRGNNSVILQIGRYF